MEGIPDLPVCRAARIPGGRKCCFAPAPFKSSPLGEGVASAFDWIFVMNTSSHETMSRLPFRALCSIRVRRCSLPRVRVFADLFSSLRPPSSALCCSLRFEVLTMKSLLTRDNSRFKLEVLVRSTSISPSLARRTLTLRKRARQDGVHVGIGRDEK